MEGKQLSKKAQKKVAQRTVYFKDILVKEELVIKSKIGHIIRKWSKNMEIRLAKLKETSKGQFIEE